MILTFLTALILFSAIYGGFAYTFRGQVFEFDPQHPGSFQTVSYWYKSIFTTIHLMGTIAAFLMGYFRIYEDAALFCMAAIFAFLFNGLINYFYESYIRVKYGPAQGTSNYTGSKYALIMALGITSTLLFLVATVDGVLAIAGW